MNAIQNKDDYNDCIDTSYDIVPSIDCHLKNKLLQNMYMCFIVNVKS